MKIVHISDWHGNFHALPEADVYVVTGDMLPNFPGVRHIPGRFGGGITVRNIDHDKERRLQADWIERKFNHPLAHKNFRQKFLASPDAPVVCVRGNHDFIDLAPLFIGGPTYEIQDPTDVFEICGLRFGGFRGINWIAGEWADEMRDDTLERAVSSLPHDLDVVVTHSPPQGVLDRVGGYPFGVRAYASWVNRCLYEEGMKLPRLLCFGHIHEANGVIVSKEQGMTVSNAATTVNVLEV